MYLLAGGISRGGAIIILVLCISAIVLLLVNAIIVIMLHKMNKKLAKRKEAQTLDVQTVMDLDKNSEKNEN